MAKLSDDGKCSQCGTRLRGRATCPRGRQCARDEVEHHRMMKMIADEKKGRARQKVSS